MGAIVLDDCLYHLRKAELCMEHYVELDAYQEIFEAENPDVKNQLVENKKASKSVLDHLKAAGEAVIKMIHNIIDAVENFFKKLKMDGDERDAYEKFKEACKKDPELKNKKITVTDYENTMKEYNALIKDIEKVERDLQEGKKTDADALIERMQKFLTGAAKGVVVSVSADAAIRLASTSKEIARGLSAACKNKELGLMETLVAGMGKHEAKKFQRDVNSLSKLISIKRLKMKITHQLCRNMDDVVMKTKEQFTSAAGLMSVAKKAMGNEEIGGLVKDTVKIAASSGVQAKKMINSEKKALKEKEKKEKKIAKRQARGDYSDQSALDVLLGTNSEKGNKIKDQGEKVLTGIDNAVDTVRSKFTKKK